MVLNIRYNRALGLRTLGRHDEAIPELLSLVRGQRRASGIHSGRTEWVDRATLDAVSRFGTAEQANDYLRGYLDDCAATGERPSREADIRVRLRTFLAEPDAP
jgi:hypothetical protein